MMTTNRYALLAIHCLWLLCSCGGLSAQEPSQPSPTTPQPKLTKDRSATELPKLQAPGTTVETVLGSGISSGDDVIDILRELERMNELLKKITSISGSVKMLETLYASDNEVAKRIINAMKTHSASHTRVKEEPVKKGKQVTRAKISPRLLLVVHNPPAAIIRVGTEEVALRLNAQVMYAGHSYRLLSVQERRAKILIDGRARSFEI